MPLDVLARAIPRALFFSPADRLTAYLRIFVGLLRGVIFYEDARVLGIDPRTAFGFERDFVRRVFVTPANS